MRHDGSITVFVLKHVHPSVIERGWDGKKWDGSGDCTQFPRQNTNGDRRNMDLFNPFMASGRVWQDWGIHGSYLESTAIEAMLEMRRTFPNYYWAVVKLEMTKKTTMMLNTAV